MFKDFVWLTVGIHLYGAGLYAFLMMPWMDRFSGGFWSIVLHYLTTMFVYVIFAFGLWALNKALKNIREFNSM